MSGGSASAKNATHERRGTQGYKSSSRVANQTRHFSGLSSGNYQNGSPSTTNLAGITQGSSGGARTQGNVSSNRNATTFGLKSETTLDFMPTAATTTSLDANMLFTKNQQPSSTGARSHSNAPAPPSAHH